MALFRVNLDRVGQGDKSILSAMPLIVTHPAYHIELSRSAGPDSRSAAKSLHQREEGAVTSASHPRYCLSACAFSAVNSASLRKVITATLRVR